MRFVRQMLDRGTHRAAPMSVGLPTSTPAFQLSAMYGVRPDIPGFHYHDKRARRDVYFPRAGDSALVEQQQAAGRIGIVDGGSTYGCVFTGGAADSVLSFAAMKRPSGAGLARVLSASVVLGWVVVKSVGVTVLEMSRAVARLVADPVGETRRGWYWLLVKIGLSVWLRQLFTLGVARDVYRGVPAIYVNYLDYDVLAHAYGPDHPRALRALGRIDRAIHQLWRVIRRVPEHRYDLYVLSDHGQARTIGYQTITGKAIERQLFDDVFDPGGQGRVGVATPWGRRVLAAIDVLRSQRSHGLFQRFLAYLERDFVARLGDLRETHERNGVRVVSAGPNAFVYFVDEPEPLTLERIEARYPAIAETLSRSAGIGLVLARSASGPVCAWRGKRYSLEDLGEGPFADRADLDVVRADLSALMAMPSAGDLVLYGTSAAEGDVSFITEPGAHAGPSTEEMQTFIVFPSRVTLSLPIDHPVQLYDHFVRYRARASGVAT